MGVVRRANRVARGSFWVTRRVFCPARRAVSVAGGAFGSACRARSSANAPNWGVRGCWSSAFVWNYSDRVRKRLARGGLGLRGQTSSTITAIRQHQAHVRSVHAINDRCIPHHAKLLQTFGHKAPMALLAQPRISDMARSLLSRLLHHSCFSS